MFSTILAYITAMAMLAGAGSVPAVPETAVKTTVENIVISSGDESVSLDHEFEYLKATGSSETAFGFDIAKGSKNLMSMKAKLTPEEMLFSLAENGGAYSVSETVAREYAELDEEALKELIEANALIAALPEIFPANSHMAFAEELYSVIEAQEAAEKSSGTIDLGGESIAAEKIELTVEAGGSLDFADIMRESETKYLSAFMRHILALANDAEGEANASFIEMEDAISGQDKYTMLKGETQEGHTTYLLLLESSDDDAALSAAFIFAPAGFSVSTDMSDEESETGIEYRCETENGIIVSATLDCTYSEGEESNCGGDESSEAQKADITLSGEYTLADGLASRSAKVEVFEENGYFEDEEQYYSAARNVIFTVSANDRLDENGAVVTGVTADIESEFEYWDVDPTRISLQAAFDVRSEEIPYADAFAGAEITPILGGEDVPPQLKGDTMMLGANMMLLVYDDQLNEVTRMIERSMEESADEAGAAEKPALPEAGIEDKHRSAKENALRGAKPDMDIPEEGDNSIDMKYKNHERDVFRGAKPEKKLPDIPFGG